MTRPGAWLWIILVATFAVYAPSLRNGFTYDDAEVVRVPTSQFHPNPLVAEFQPLSTYFTTSYSEGHGGHGRGFRPITVISFALVHQFTKSADAQLGQPVAPAWPQHLVNILLHCLCAWLTFRLLVLFVGVGFPAVLGTAVFGLHAVRSDPVISMVGRGELQAFAFGAGALLLVVAALRRTGGARTWRLAVAGLSLFLALGSKESAAPWLVMIPLAVSILQPKSPAADRPGWSWMLWLIVPFVVFVGLLFNIWSHLPEKFEPAYDSNPLWYQTAVIRVVTAVVVLGYALYKVFAPFYLCHDYSAEVFTVAESAADARFLVAAGILLTVLVLGTRMLRRAPPVFLAVASFFGFSFLTSNIPFPIETIFGERLLYTPALALSFLVAWLAQGRRFRVVLGVTVVWCIVGGALIFKRDFDWFDNRTLFGNDAVRNELCIRNQMAYVQFVRMQDPAAWKAVIDRAYAANNTNPSALCEMAAFYNNTGQPALAEQFARRGLESQHVDVRDQREDLELELAIALGAQNKRDAAIQFFEKCINRGPEPPPAPRAFYEYAGFLERQGRLQSARSLLRRLLRRNPRDVIAWEKLLFLAVREKDEKRVDALLREASQAIPGAPQLALHQGMALHRRGQVQRGAQMFMSAIRGLPELPDTVGYYAFFAARLVEGQQVQQARDLVARFLQNPYLDPVEKAPFVALARRLGLLPPK